MVLGVIHLSFEVPWSRSLKDKRQCLQRMRDQLKRRFNISCAEVAAFNLRKRGELGIAQVGAERSKLRHTLQNIRAFLERDPEIVLLDYAEEIL